MISAPIHWRHRTLLFCIVERLIRWREKGSILVTRLNILGVMICVHHRICMLRFGLEIVAGNKARSGFRFLQRMLRKYTRIFLIPVFTLASAHILEVVNTFRIIDIGILVISRHRVSVARSECHFTGIDCQKSQLIVARDPPLFVGESKNHPQAKIIHENFNKPPIFENFDHHFWSTHWSFNINFIHFSFIFFIFPKFQKNFDPFKVLFRNFWIRIIIFIFRHQSWLWLWMTILFREASVPAIESKMLFLFIDGIELSSQRMSAASLSNDDLCFGLQVILCSLWTFVCKMRWSCFISAWRTCSPSDF